jgi:cephalosporin-C deacetylase-like acetyl esterase
MNSLTTRLLAIVTTAVFLRGPSLRGEETGAERHAMAKAQLQRVAAEMSARCLSDVRTLEDWQKQRPQLRRRLLEMLGLDPLPARTPLKAQITGKLEHPTYRIEKLVFQSMPGLYVTGNFYVPAGSPRSLPTILYLCGHMPHPLGAKFHYQDRGIWFASHGYACLVLDTLEFGELSGIHHGTHSLNMWYWLSLGYTPAGVEVWNAIRALDYLETRPEVDAKRMGLTGISGGGAITWYTAAVDERIAAAAPVCSTITFGSQAKNWVAHGQCDCIYYHNTYQLDFPVVGALIAPRPLLILSARKDWVFPPDGYHEAFRRMKKIYDLYAEAGTREERIREVDDDVEHTDAPLFVREARLWMQRWVQGDTSPLPLETGSPVKESAQALACLSEVPKDAVNFRIHQQFTAAVALKQPNSAAVWEARRADLMRQMREKVFRWFPRVEVPFETKGTGKAGGWAARYGYAAFQEYSFQTESKVRIRAQLYLPQNHSGAPLLIYVKRSSDSVATSDVDELLALMGRYAILVLNPRFTEQSMTPAEYADMERSSVWVGRSIAAAQVWDILRALDWATREEKLSASSIAIYGKGEMGILCLYAALFDERIKQVILTDPPGSHWQGPALLNVLRVTDIPEIAGALAPRRLVSLTKLSDSFELARGIYRLQGASEQIMQASSLPEALEVWKVRAH